MKKILISLLALLWLIPAAQAVPAAPGTYRVRQPDGTFITLQNHGDEYYHWTTDEFGHTVEKQADGFYRTVFISPEEHQARARQARARQPFRARWSSYDNPFAVNFGSRKVLCFIAEFAPEDPAHPGAHDKFVLANPKAHFSDMLNKPGYDYNGAIGSVRDYFMENSIDENNLPQYLPEFDVYGPVTLSHSSSYYDSHGVYLAILEAYEALKDEIDINLYDTDNNGVVDMVLFYYPGYNEAEGGPEETIWPHATSNMNFGMMGNKKFMRYFCTSELRGKQGQTAAGIGTTCHEFAHALGLPDFYDRDEEKNGENTTTTGFVDLMVYGPYNDLGRKPPYLTSLERNMLGWMPSPETIETEDAYVLEAIQGNHAYRIDTRIPGEFFLLECRNGEGWDSGLYSKDRGLVIFHVDQSNRFLADGITAAYLWRHTNDINCYGGHPCYYVVPSYESYLAFPGPKTVRVFEPEDWDGFTTGMTLSDIAFAGGRCTFNVELDWGRFVEGYVKDGTGAPLADVTVSSSRSHYRFSAPSRLSTDVECVTDEYGYYSLELDVDAPADQILTARKDGYVPQSVNLSLSDRFTRQDYTLFAPGQPPVATLKKYDEYLDMTSSSITNSPDIAVAMNYTYVDVSRMGLAGAKISDITFFSAAEGGETVYVLVQMGGERVLCEDVTELYRPNTYVTVDISDKNIYIQEGKYIYIGYGFSGINNDYPFCAFGPMKEDNGGAFMMPDFLNNPTGWRAFSFADGVYNFIISANLIFPAENNFATYGVGFIKLENNIPQVVPAAGKTPLTTIWYLDGTALYAPPGSIDDLPPGPHTYMARVLYYDGTTERVYYDVTGE